MARSGVAANGVAGLGRGEMISFFGGGGVVNGRGDVAWDVFCGRGGGSLGFGETLGSKLFICVKEETKDIEYL